MMIKMRKKGEFLGKSKKNVTYLLLAKRKY